MSDTFSLVDHIKVSPRFTRSVALLRDFESPSALDGYILTPNGRSVIERLADSLRGVSPTRAWSLTGPYGSGKSALALLVAQILSGSESIRIKARSYLLSEDAQLWYRLFAADAPLAKRSSVFVPVLISGSRLPLEKVIARHLAVALRNFFKRRRPAKIVEELEKIADDANPDSNTGSRVVSLFEEAHAYFDRFGNEIAGLLLVIDELGKFLEYGVSRPDQGDVFILQGLAEVAARVQRPFLFLTILHQSLDRYAEQVSPARRVEWAKIQGRFEDVAFEERSEQIVRLLARAVQPVGPAPIRDAIAKRGRSLAEEASAMGIHLGTLSQDEQQSSLAAAFPLHPLTAVTVGPLFRQLAQNERSLFAFLSANEPFGFQEFLRRSSGTARHCEPYRLDRLYDYATTVVGPALYAHHRGKHWAEVQSVVERLNASPPLEGRIAKVIGLLQALGSAVSFPACRQIIQFALCGADVAEADIDAALESLVRRSMIVFRRHTGGYALWEGSDIDLESRVEEARRTIDPNRGLSSFLAGQGSLRPLVARRHSYETGTLRYFESCYATREDLPALIDREFGNADGRIIYCLPLTADDRQAMEAVLRSPLENISPAFVAAIPNDVGELKEWTHEVASLQWVLHHTPELTTDLVARREIRSRLANAENTLRNLLQNAFRPGKGDSSRCLWLHEGEGVPLVSPRELNELLSRICDKVYPHTPIWRNELINRRSLSSSAAAARRDLIEAMIAHSGDEHLAIEGTPPQRCMYETLLLFSGLHRKVGGTWGFHPPLRSSKAGTGLVAIWESIEKFLDETETVRQPITRLFLTLGRPPFGLKEGVLPVLLAAILLHFDAELALYEEGTFVPRLSPPILERMLRGPQRFEIQRCRIRGVRGAVLSRYAALIAQGTRADREGPPRLLEIVRWLTRLVRGLPDYVCKTRQLGANAQAVLRVLREARQPDRLLFTDLPVACGLPPFSIDKQTPGDMIETFFESLQDALAELQLAYPRLMSEIEVLLLKAFDHRGPLAKARTDLEHQARIVMNVAVDTKLKSFLLRVMDAATEDRIWLESLASLLGGKPPATWDDQDRVRYEVQLAATARMFQHFKVLAFEMARDGAALLDGDPQLMRVSITVPNGPELERVVPWTNESRDRLRATQEQVREVLASADLLDDRELTVAFLAEMVRELIAESVPKDRSPA